MKYLLATSGLLALITRLSAQTPETQGVFLRERITITTNRGVTGVAPGTRVFVVARHGDKVTVKSEDQQFEVAADQITTDSQLARSLSQQDGTQQQALQQQAAEKAARIREAAASQQRAIAQQSSQTGNQTKATDPRLERIRKRRIVLNLRLERIQFEQRDMPPPNGPTYWRNGRLVISTSPNSFALQQERKAIERELLDLKEQETLIGLGNR